jgi:biopolymer transport protein ExbB
MNLLDILMKGGVLIIPIVICSIISIAVLIERLFLLRKIKVNARTFSMHVQSLIRKGKITEAISICKRTPGPVAKITKAAIAKFDKSREEIKEAVESAGKVEIHQLERNLGIVGTIAAIAPLLGFLGTVTGMIKAFMRIQEKKGMVDADVLAGGIWEALVTTAAGLAVGILSIIFYNWLQSKVEHIVFEMEENSTTLIDIIHNKEGEQFSEFPDES